AREGDIRRRGRRVRADGMGNTVAVVPADRRTHAHRRLHGAVLGSQRPRDHHGGRPRIASRAARTGAAAGGDEQDPGETAHATPPEEHTIRSMTHPARKFIPDSWRPAPEPLTPAQGEVVLTAASLAVDLQRLSDLRATFSPRDEDRFQSFGTDTLRSRWGAA